MKLTLSLIRITSILLILSLMSHKAMAHECVMPKASKNYDTSECVFDHLIKISKDGKYGAMDERGIVIIPLMFEEIGEFYDGVARVRYKDKFGFMTHLGLIIIPMKYDDAGFFNNGTALVRQNGEYFMINGQGWRVMDDKPATPLSDMSDIPNPNLAHELLSGEPVIPEPSH